MKELKSLIKVSLNHDMNLFKINTRKQTTFSKYVLPLILALYLMILIGIYAVKMIKLLEPIHLEYVTLSFFAIAVVFLTIIEGIYKSGSLLFNCKDDQLLLSLPIKKRTVLFIRIFKFYIFELLYNSLFLLPVIIAYAYYIHPSFSYYLVSIIAILILPIIPVVLSCIIGFIITYLSSMFKGKNIVQTIITMFFLLIIFYISYNMESFTNNLVKKANSLNEIITKLYYPVGAYTSLVNSFNIKDFLIYIFSHIIIIILTIFILSKLYFKINSNNKKVLINHNKNSKYIVKTNNRLISFIKKEFNRFVTTPVFIINAGFGLILFIVICIFVSIRFDTAIRTFTNSIPNIDVEAIKANLPIYMFGLVCFSSLMTSITSSMISLENKSFNILKSLPIKSYMIVLYKVVTALVIMIPCILLGDIIIFIRFKFDIVSIILILIATIILPFVSEIIGIIANLKYPKLDATNDTEIVKQSMSSMISVFAGMGLTALTIIVISKLLIEGISRNMIMLLLLVFYGLLGIGLFMYLVKTCDKSFNNINS